MGPGSRFSWSRVGRIAAAVARRFYDDQCLMRASALAYTALLSIVPLLALMFAVLKGLGVQHRLEPLLLSRLSLAAETTELIVGYIDRTNVSTLGLLGAVALLVTVVSVLGTIESSFNHIWRVNRQRTLWRQVTDYLGVVLLTPFLLLAAVAITSAGQVQQVLMWVVGKPYVGKAAMTALQLTPILINSVAIGVLYAVMPNRRPAWRPLFISAFVAGIAWHLVQWAYVSLQIGVAGNNAIYGALAQLPVTLVWLYVSWTIVLGGAELAAVLEFGIASRAGSGVPDPKAIALHLLVRGADEFVTSGQGIAELAEARVLAVELGVVTSIAAQLQQMGWLAALEGHPHRFLLARTPENIELSGLASLGSGTSIPPHCDPRACRAVEEIRTREPELWKGRTLADVLHMERAHRSVGARAQRR
jgi:membrane protein